MNELQIFNSPEFGDIRTVEIDGKPYFVGADVAKALGYKDTVNALKQHCRGVVKHHLTDSLGRSQEASFISEGDLYRLIMKSKLPSAEKFESWVMDEILPTIRKTGSYQKPLTVAEQIQLLAQGTADHEERIEKLENTMTIDYGQQKYIGDLVSIVVIEALGGKDSNAYSEIGKKVFAECNRDVKSYFGVNARNNIPKLRYEEAVKYIKGWQPCTNTKMQIRDCNYDINSERK